MAGRPKRRAEQSEEAGSRARAPRARPPSKRDPAAAAKRKRGPDRPRFEPANPDDFARVQAGVAVAAEAAEAARKAASPAERAAALEGFGLVASGRAREDKALLAAAARVRRDEAIVAAWALGLTAPTIGTQFNLSADYVVRVIDAHRERRRTQVVPASGELLHDALEAIEAQMERCTLIASRTQASESARVGAIRTWREMFITRLELLQHMGHLTTSPSAEARLGRARDLLRNLLDGLRAENVPQEVIDRVATRVLSAGGEDLENVIAIETRAR